MRTLLFLLIQLPLLAVAGGWFTPALAQSTLEKVKDSKHLVVGINPGQVPYGSLAADGSWAGFDVDLAREIAKRLDAELEIVQVTGKSRIPTLLSGKADAMLGGLARTAEREKVVDFSIPYIVEGEKLLVKTGSSIRSADDLVDRTVATTQGSTSEKIIREAQPGARLLRFQELPQAFLALKQGLADAFISSELILAKFATQEPGAYEIVGPALLSYPVAIGVRKEDSEWLDAINGLMLDMEKDGTYKTVFNRWFGAESEFGLPVPDLSSLK